MHYRLYMSGGPLSLCTESFIPYHPLYAAHNAPFTSYGDLVGSIYNTVVSTDNGVDLVLLDSPQVSLIAPFAGQAGCLEESDPSNSPCLWGSVDISKQLPGDNAVVVKWTIKDSKGKYLVKKKKEKTAPYSVVTNKEFAIPALDIKFCEVYTIEYHAEVKSSLKGKSAVCESKSVQTKFLPIMDPETYTYAAEDIGSCSHDPLEYGDPLGGCTDPLVQRVISYDNWCGYVYWDSLCVDEFIWELRFSGCPDETTPLVGSGPLPTPVVANDASYERKEKVRPAQGFHP